MNEFDKAAEDLAQEMHEDQQHRISELVTAFAKGSEKQVDREIRMKALEAASRFASGPNWGGTVDNIIGLAQVMEKYLRDGERLDSTEIRRLVQGER